MAPYADFEFYQTEYGGTAIGADAFLRLSNAASQYIDTATMGRAKRASGDTLKAVRMAMCQIADVMNDEGIVNANSYSAEPVVASESNSTWSQTYSTRSISQTEIELLDKRKSDALLLWLGNTGLLAARGYYAPPRGKVRMCR